jgi:hypothetical protein
VRNDKQQGVEQVLGNVRSHFDNLQQMLLQVASTVLLCIGPAIAKVDDTTKKKQASMVTGAGVARGGLEVCWMSTYYLVAKLKKIAAA